MMAFLFTCCSDNTSKDTDDQPTDDTATDTEVDRDTTLPEDVDGYTFDGFYSPSLYGHLSLGVSHYGAPSGMRTSFWMRAQFYETLQEKYEPSLEDSLDPLERIGDCGLNVVTHVGVKYAAGDLDFKSPGTVTLLGGPEPVRVEPEGLGITVEDLVEPQYGHTYTVSAVGAETPSFSLPLDLPVNISEISGTRQDNNDFRVNWDGGTGEGLVTIRFNSSAETDDPEMTDSYRLTCIVPDSGSFTIPGALMSQIPPDTNADILVARGVEHITDIAEDKLVYTSTSVSHRIPLDWTP
jgi:hypothetical protein